MGPATTPPALREWAQVLGGGGGPTAGFPPESQMFMRFIVTPLPFYLSCSRSGFFARAPADYYSTKGAQRLCVSRWPRLRHAFYMLAHTEARLRCSARRSPLPTRGSYVIRVSTLQTAADQMSRSRW